MANGEKEAYSGTNSQRFVHPTLHTRVLPQTIPIKMKVASSSKTSLPIYQVPCTAAHGSCRIYPSPFC